MHRRPAELTSSLHPGLLTALLLGLAALTVGAATAPAAPPSSATPGSAAAAAAPAAVGLDDERARIEEWRAERVSSLTGDSGWLTLVGLFWLTEGTNTFGRSAANSLRLDNPSLAPECGYFLVRQHKVRFIARPR